MPATDSVATVRAREGARQVVFTDGACIGNPGPGGWAWARSAEEFDSGGDPWTTNQRMEVRAVLEAVRRHPGPLEVVSDSAYVVNCFRDRWWQGWRARGWRNSRGEAVANQDLWRELLALVVDGRPPGEVSFRKVKGHSGDAMNELVDRLANEQARRAGPGAPGVAFLARPSTSPRSEI